MTDTQIIKDKIDIVDFISEYVQLKPAGVNHKGCCPFHQEKTPSFMVNRERQSWHCFGCSKSGDIFSFLQEIEGMEFVEALKFLADRAGIQLEYRASDINSSQKNRLKEINKEAARFFHNFLLKMDSSKIALEYLDGRGLSQNTIEKWQIGYIPDQWELLTQYLLKKGYSIDDLVSAGLTIKRDGADAQSQRGFYDRFRGRIMFPIWDVHGTVIGFTGRVLVETATSGGKYVNTPQTDIYDKSRVVFGLNFAKQEIKTKDLIVMVEGQMDVIACHQAGMQNVVASSGTALTEQQVKLLKRYSTKINIAFDADSAGQAAAKRGIDVAVREGMHVKVIIIPEGQGKDPDECIKRNKQVWFDTVENAEGIMKWYFDRAFVGRNLLDPKQKQAIADELLREIILIPHAVEADHWLRELSAKLNVDVLVLRESMKQTKEREKLKKTQNYNASEPLREIKLPENNRLDVLLERLFMVLFRFPENLKSKISNMKSEILSTSIYGALYHELNKVYNESALIDIKCLRDNIADDNLKNIIDLLLMKGDLEYQNFSIEQTNNEINQLLDQILAEWARKRRTEIQSEIAIAEKNNNQEQLQKLLNDFQKLNY